MALDAYSKVQRKQLRDLAGQAYETELKRELARLLEDFQSWQAGALSPYGTKISAQGENMRQVVARK